jgi:transposase-like protein
MERRKFTREFKLEAVRLIKQRGVGYPPRIGRDAAPRPNRTFALGPTI